MIILIIMAFALAGLLIYPDLIRKQWWYELAVTSLFLIAGFILSLLLYLQVQLPYLSLVISHFLRGIAGQ